MELNKGISTLVVDPEKALLTKKSLSAPSFVFGFLFLKKNFSGVGNGSTFSSMFDSKHKHDEMPKMINI